MKPLRLTLGLLAAMALLASTASVTAQPYAAGKGHEQRKPNKHHQQHRYPPQQQRNHQGQSPWLWQNQREMHRSPPHQQRPLHHPRPPHHRGPPHRDQMRRDIHRSSHYLRPGPPLPRHMHLVVGRPLPHGWTHRVPPGQLKHLPRYPGYEWHSAGRDLVLVAAATGMVYTILDNVLN